MYKLAADVFYRKYGNNTIIYQTSKSQVHVMSEMCFHVLEYFNCYSSSESLYEYFSKLLELDEKSMQELNEFTSQIEKLGLIISDKKTNYGSELEARIFEDGTIPKVTLYSCMLELTYRCNERCKHCYCVTDNADGELTTAEIKGLLDQLKDMNTFEITFTGGDIFVRGDTFEILEYAYSLGFLIKIFTNGIALKEEDFFRLQKIHPKTISFSIYDSIPEKHDAFTTVPGSFKRTVAAAKKCRSLGMPVTIKSNITHDNKDRLQDLIKLVQEIDAGIEVTTSITPRNNGDMSPTELRLSGLEEYNEIFEIVEKYLIGDATELSLPEIEDNRKLCWAGEKGISINPYGKAYACNALLAEIGDVRKQSIKDIWENSDELKKIRMYRVNDLIGCDDCEDRKYCSFCMGNALNETGNPLMKYQEACNITKAQSGLRKEKKDV